MSTTYSDYLRDRTGWFFGLTGLQLTLLALGGLPVWLTVNAARWAWLLLWIPVWLLLTFLGRRASQGLDSCSMDRRSGGARDWGRDGLDTLAVEGRGRHRG
jgi:membrane protein implicated in regulation of membrane protease activity